jgi:hypothetical protein
MLIRPFVLQGFNFNCNRNDLLSAPQLQIDLLSNRRKAHNISELRRASDPNAVCCGYDVTLGESGLRRW